MDDGQFFANWTCQIRRGLLELTILNDIGNRGTYAYEIEKTLCRSHGLLLGTGVIYIKQTGEVALLRAQCMLEAGLPDEFCALRPPAQNTSEMFVSEGAQHLDCWRLQRDKPPAEGRNLCPRKSTQNRMSLSSATEHCPQRTARVTALETGVGCVPRTIPSAPPLRGFAADCVGCAMHTFLLSSHQGTKPRKKNPSCVPPWCNPIYTNRRNLEIGRWSPPAFQEYAPPRHG
jgi:hypothetical protein